MGLGCMNIMVTPCRKVAHIQESTRTSFFSYFTLLSLSFFLFISDTLVTDYLIAHSQIVDKTCVSLRYFNHGIRYDKGC